MAQVEVDASEVQAFIDRLGQAARGDFKKRLALFLKSLGFEFLRILQDEIVRLRVLDTRQLLSSFHGGGKENIWKLSLQDLTLEVGTNVEYAKYVNDGHWTNKKGVKMRFVPGVWKGDKFEYQPGAKTGMVLKQQWVEGSHYWESALRIFETIFPELLERKLEEWLNDYFKDFM